MKTLDLSKDKRTYLPPAIECIGLDNEISLALESVPASNNEDEVYNAPDHFNNDPFKAGQG